MPLLVAGAAGARTPGWVAGRWCRATCWAVAGGLTAYGTLLTVVGVLVATGVVEAADDADHRAIAWHAFLWDPWFALWGMAFVVVMWRTRPDQVASSGAGAAQ